MFPVLCSVLKARPSQREEEPLKEKSSEPQARTVKNNPR